MAVSVEEIGKIRDFVLKQVMEKNRCLVIGPEDLMNKFGNDNGIRIDYIMADSLNVDNEVESKPVKMYNVKSKEVFLLSLTDKDSLVNAITQGMRVAENFTDHKEIVVTKEEDILLKHLLGAELIKKKYRDGYQFSADIMLASSEKEKIRIIKSIFRRPPENIINEMRTLLEDRSIIELDDRFGRSARYYLQKPHEDSNERLSESLGIDENRLDELQKIFLKLNGKSTSSGEFNGPKSILGIDHEAFLDFLEKEEGISNKERLYMAFGLGGMMQEFAAEMNQKCLCLDKDRDERIKSIGKMYACEITKSLTLSKIDNLKDLDLKEKLIAVFWAGLYNSKFYQK